MTALKLLSISRHKTADLRSRPRCGPATPPAPPGLIVFASQMLKRTHTQLSVDVRVILLWTLSGTVADIPTHRQNSQASSHFSDIAALACSGAPQFKSVPTANWIGTQSLAIMPSSWEGGLFVRQFGAPQDTFFGPTGDPADPPNRHYPPFHARTSRSQ